jgi:CDGSH-type Zn-finger protein
LLIGAIEIKLNLGELNAGGIAMEIKTAKNEPYPVEVIKDQTYYWCSCGLSENQPFCDASHQRTEMTPLEFIATENMTVYFCGCKQSANAPLCDGTHSCL